MNSAKQGLLGCIAASLAKKIVKVELEPSWNLGAHKQDVAGKIHFFLEITKLFHKTLIFFETIVCFQEIFQFCFGEAKTFWRSSEEIVTGTPCPGNMFRSFFWKEHKRGCSLS